ncbi:MAG: hypothetical protein NT056_04220 [Proteobacteria bacterium]|nr:hypothetical protein [Pseudomonadota bacterium]
MLRTRFFYRFAVTLIIGTFLVCSGFACGSSSTTTDLLTAPDFVRGEASGMVIVGEKALGKIWTVGAEDYEIPEKVGDDGKKAMLPVLSLEESILDIKMSPDGNRLVLMAENATGTVLRSYETQGFTVQGTLNLPDPPRDFTVVNGGAVYLLPAEASGSGGSGLIMKLPDTLSAAEAQTLAVIPEPRGLELAPDGAHLLLRYEPGEARFGWLGLADFNQVTDIPWTPELSGVGACRTILFTPQAYPGGAVMIIPEGQAQAYKFSLDQTESTLKLDLKGLTGGIVTGKLSGDPVLIWVTLTGYLHLFDFSSGCYGNLGSDASSAGSATFTDIDPISNPGISKIKTSNCLGVTESETWTITYTGAGWQVEGTISGAQTGLAQEGEAYTTAGGELSFLLSAGETPASAGDAFSVTTLDGIIGKYVGAVAPQLYLDETRGWVWITDTSGGRILVVDPLTGSNQKIIY